MSEKFMDYDELDEMLREEWKKHLHRRNSFEVIRTPELMGGWQLIAPYGEVGPKAKFQLDAVAVWGLCQITEAYSSFWGEGKDYRSPVLDCPTWLNVLMYANEAILVTGDYHHIFFEGISENDRNNGGVRNVSLSMGS